MKFIKNNSILILSTINLLLLSYLVFFRFIQGDINFQTPGLIGDFVGGVIGTVLTAIAAIFVYRTYKNQDQQLGQQKKEANQNLIDNLYDRITKDIEDLEITFEKPGPLVKG
jgi:K+ transporter